MFFIASNNKRWALLFTLTAIFENVKIVSRNDFRPHPYNALITPS